MSFDWNNIKRMSHGPSVGVGGSSVKSLWMFSSNDDISAVETTGYFNTAVNEMRVGDIIMATLDLDGTPVGKNYLVSAKTATVVTIKGFEDES